MATISSHPEIQEHEEEGEDLAKQQPILLLGRRQATIPPLIASVTQCKTFLCIWCECSVVNPIVPHTTSYLCICWRNEVKQIQSLLSAGQGKSGI